LRCAKILLLLSSLTLTACLSVSRESDVVGSSGASMVLILLSRSAPDHTYAQKATMRDRPTETASGRWRFENGRISFENLLIPGSVVGKNERIIRGGCGLSAESHYGGPIKLILDPDRDLGFTRLIAKGWMNRRHSARPPIPRRRDPSRFHSRLSLRRTVEHGAGT